MSAVRDDPEQATTPAAGTAARPVRAPRDEDASPRLVGRRLRWIALAAPMAFFLLLEAVHYHLEHSPWWSPGFAQAWHVAVALAVCVGIGIFSWLMLRHIDRAEWSIVAQNRDLKLADTVAASTHEQPDAQGVADAAARVLAGVPGLRCVRLRLNPREGDPTLESVAGRSPELVATAIPALDRTLAEGDRAVGRIEVWASDHDLPGEHIGPATEAALALQVAGAARLKADFADLYRRRDEGHAFYAILLAISRQSGTLPTLTDLATHARDLLDADAAAVVVTVAAANTVRFDSTAEVPQACSDGSTLLGVGLPDHFDEVTGQRVNPIGCLHWGAHVEHGVTGLSGRVGTLWVGRRDERPFTERDRSFLATMAGLASIALTSAKVREQERQREVLNERTRIAREMHDSMAQVLGAMHLRLRMLETFPSVTGDADTAEQVSALAETADEAYRDVREVILGLRDSDKADLTLEENLEAYTAKFAAQSGIVTEFRNETGGPVQLSPRTEVHLIRVVQEALTNVRKHARATRATVTITGTDATTVTIADDGQGFYAPTDVPTTDGYGLFTMRDRLSLLHGTLELESFPGIGTRVNATVPEPPSRTPRS